MHMRKHLLALTKLDTNWYYVVISSRLNSTKKIKQYCSIYSFILNEFQAFPVACQVLNGTCCCFQTFGLQPVLCYAMSIAICRLWGLGWKPVRY